MSQAHIGPITTGVWKISCDSRWLRDVDGKIQLSPEEGGRGDHRSMWRLDYNSPERGNEYVITNIATGANAWAAPPKEKWISAGKEVRWLVTSAGEGQQHIQWPNEDWYWTVEGSSVRLEGLEGLPTQVWEFHWVGDF